VYTWAGFDNRTNLRRKEPPVPRLTLEISISLDGFVAGPNPTLEQPLGEGGELLHEWAFATRAFREQHGLDGGEDSRDSELVAETLARVGATIMGRKMFSGGEGAWAGDPNAGGWWGDEPPFGHPVFVLTHHERESLELRGTTFTFVTDGIEAALELARAAAGDKDVALGGGARVAQQYLRAGLLDELNIHLAPVLLGDGVRLFDGDTGRLELDRVVASPRVTHLRYVPRHR
jgi:dihydrofolate reductase